MVITRVISVKHLCLASRCTQDQLKQEVLDMAKRVGISGFNLLVIDTENKVCCNCASTAMPDYTPLP